jgi:hypothetical protein
MVQITKGVAFIREAKIIIHLEMRISAKIGRIICHSRAILLAMGWLITIGIFSTIVLVGSR